MSSGFPSNRVDGPTFGNHPTAEGNDIRVVSTAIIDTIRFLPRPASPGEVPRHEIKPADHTTFMDPYHRRTILKTVGTATITTALAGCSSEGDGETQTEAETETPASDGEPSHETPHPDDETLADSEATGAALSGGNREPGSQNAKDNPSVMLQHTTNEGQNCGTCSLYVPDQNDDGFGACTTVAGKIHPCDWCLLYTEYSEGEGVPCE
jgi:hypothetical protein